MTRPLDGVRVVELSHMVMGPTCGMVLGDLGADVVKVEPLAGDKTRDLAGLGAGFFRAFNRNKRSIALDLQSGEGLAVLQRLIKDADIFCENFRPGRMAQLGLDYETVSALNPALIYVSHKGFLPGPYAHRKALDEVVQMMGGFAYMTGPPGRPLRAGASVNDIMGGVFGALAAVAALRERQLSGHGQQVQAGLFENCAFLMAQHMQQYARTGADPMPMPNRLPAWAIYEIFPSSDGEQVFVAVTGDAQWRDFCRMLDRRDWLDNPGLVTNTDRVAARPWLLPQVRTELSALTAECIAEQCEVSGIPYAKVVRPQELFDDAHLVDSGALAELTVEDGTTTQIPLLPILMDGHHLRPRRALPGIGEHSTQILRQLDYDEKEIESMRQRNVFGEPVDVAGPA